MPEHWVINASPTILLAKAGLIELVPRLRVELIIPQPVASEVLNASEKDAASHWLHGQGKIFIKAPVTESPLVTGWQIGPGERAVISWAAAHPGHVAVLDDFEARHVARQLGLKIIGTVGVVLRLKIGGLISEAGPHLKKIREVGGYISDDLFHEALRQVGEQS